MRRIVLVRPAVEAGERLGFLPGDLAQKVDPYLRPMYDALYEMMGFDRVARIIERQVIEVAPLAFMRGRSLNDSFIILDEAQNTTVEQMKMFLTRIGFGSKAVVTGDVTQTDLPRQQRSGLRHAIEVLRGVEGVAFTFFNARDVVRHPLVQRIVQAYERESGDAGARGVSAAPAPRFRDRGAVRRACGRGCRPQAALRRWARRCPRFGHRGAACAQARGSRNGAGTPAFASSGRGEPPAEPRVSRQGQADQRAVVPGVGSRERELGGALGDLVICAAGGRQRGAASSASRGRRTGRTWSCTACCTCSATTTSDPATPARMERARSGDPAPIRVSESLPPRDSEPSHERRTNPAARQLAAAHSSSRWPASRRTASSWPRCCATRASAA